MVSLSEAQSSCPMRVLEAALEVFGESGYRGSIDAVAKRAGVARQTIYNNFDNKDALFLAAIEMAVGELFSVLDEESDDWYLRLVRFSLQFRERVLSPEAISLHRVLVSEAPRFPELAGAFYQRVVMMKRQRLAKLIENAIQKGCLRDEDPLEMADFFLDLLVASDHRALLFGTVKLDPALEEKKVKRALELFGRAYANPDFVMRKDVP